MSELQDELNEIGSTLNHWPAVMAAARRVADSTPTYLVYTRQDDVEYLGHIYQGDEAKRMADNPNLPGDWFTVLDITTEDE